MNRTREIIHELSCSLVYCWHELNLQYHMISQYWQCNIGGLRPTQGVALKSLSTNLGDWVILGIPGPSVQHHWANGRISKIAGSSSELPVLEMKHKVRNNYYRRFCQTNVHGSAQWLMWYEGKEERPQLWKGNLALFSYPPLPPQKGWPGRSRAVNLVLCWAWISVSGPASFFQERISGDD